MVSSDCLASVDLCFLRVAGLTSGGVPRAGSHGYKTDLIETAKIGTVDDTINETIRRNGCGEIVNRVAAVTSVKGSACSFDLTAWERDLIALLIGGTTGVSSGHTIAWRAPAAADGPPDPVCLEFWSKAWDGSTQAVSAGTSPNVAYHVWVMPFVQCSLSSQFTLANGDTVFTVTGEGSENPQITADGPWNDWPAAIAGKGGFKTAFGEYETSTLPTGACGLATVPATS